MSKHTRAVIVGLLIVVLTLTISGCGPGFQPTLPKPAPEKPATQELAPPVRPDQPAQTPPAEPSEPSTVPKQASPRAIADSLNLKVHFIDVGQGDSISIQLPGGKTMLIDAGEATQGSTVVAYLKAQGVRTVDYLVATHPHADHIGGMAAVLDAFSVVEVLMPRTGHTTTTYENLLLKLKDKRLKVTEAKAGVTVFEASNLSAVFIAPRGNKYDDINEWSAVVRIKYGETVFLFTGDAGAESEGEMLLSSAVSPDADVLKVGHHGSSDSTSAQFLKAVSPQYAVISVGAGNSYGHPHKETLARLAAHRVRVYRTDLHGTVVFTSDGKSIAVKTGKPGQPSTTLAPPGAPEGTSVTPTQAPPSTPSNQEIVTVYVTKAGKKYHRDGCRSLSQSKIPMSLSEAKAKGYGPCSVCRPPQ